MPDEKEVAGGQILAFDGENYEWMPNTRMLPQGWYTGVEGYNRANGIKESEAAVDEKEETQSEPEPEPVEEVGKAAPKKATKKSK